MKYSETHEWITTDGDMATVGITDYAQKELGDIVYVELPETGKHVRQGEEVVVLESTKAAADVYSPVSGEITAINENLEGESAMVNRSPEMDGWLYKIRLDAPDELSQLMDKEKYEAFLK